MSESKIDDGKFFLTLKNIDLISLKKLEFN